ncbi:MAG: GNAT family N-acetyltransferase [Gammaproteobacteria bacterium]|nr:GNAT family N-acetyltransferase [Gammaproteobacteria bacterium]
MAAQAICAALRTLGTGKELLLIGSQGDEVVAMFMLVPQGKLRWHTFQPSQLPLGAWVAAAHLPLQELARSLLHGPLGLCLALSITQVDPHLAARMPDAADSQQDDDIDTGWIKFNGTFDEYWSARGKNLRQNMRKQRVKLAADGVKLTLQVLRDRADMAPAVARYGRMESAGWKAQHGTAIHPDNSQGRYYRELLEQASLNGEAVVYEYLFDDRVVAMNLCLTRKDVLIVLKTTYDESIQSLSPAFLLREAELQELFAEGKIRRLEYFGRLMDWHTKWTDYKRTLYHLTQYRWPLLKRLALARRRRAEAASREAVAASSTSASTVGPSE